jgi:chorismate mutase
MPVRGIRGANTVSENTADSILTATRELLKAILQKNPTMHPGDLASIIFTVTEDLTAIYPAKAARELGWNTVPLLCSNEIPVPNSLTRCVRVLIHWNTDLPQESINHIYLGEATTLRPDLTKI